VEVSVSPAGQPLVHRVSCTIDCGQVVNPGIVEAQAEGSIVWALTASLMNEITIERGVPRQRHFGDNPVMRMRDMPELRIGIIESRESPHGAGEPCVVPVAPALVAALNHLARTPVRRLPVRQITPRAT
jgi:isoquinoline 1-oxidoreductase/isoquinoline 1-oxidoreductase beta subunit